MAECMDARARKAFRNIGVVIMVTITAILLYYIEERLCLLPSIANMARLSTKIKGHAVDCQASWLATARR
jgi:hypothetical protein